MNIHNFLAPFRTFTSPLFSHSTVPSTRPLHSTCYGHHLTCATSVTCPRSQQPHRRHCDEENIRHKDGVDTVHRTLMASTARSPPAPLSVSPQTDAAISQ